MTDEQEILHVFVAEGFELIDDIEPKLISLVRSNEPDHRPPDEELINAVFRLFHSVKGSAASLGLEQIARVTHAAETLLEAIRNGKTVIAPQPTPLFLRTIDFLRLLLERVQAGGTDGGLEGAGDLIIAELEQARIGKRATTPTTIPATRPQDGFADKFVQEGLELLEVVEGALIALSKRPESTHETMGELFRALHSFKGNAGFLGFGDLEKLSHAGEELLEEMHDTGSAPSPDVVMTLLMVTDSLKDGVKDVAGGGFGAIPGFKEMQNLINSRRHQHVPPDKKTGPKPTIPENRTEHPDPEEKEIPRLGEILVANGDIAPETLQKALKIQAASTPSSEERIGAHSATPVRRDIRVDLEKLDRLVNLIGELVIAESLVTHNIDLRGLELEHFDRAAHNLRRITAEIQDTTMSLRMVPLSTTFQKLIRVVHDLSTKSGKRIRFEVHGEETEVDKTVTELIGDPLVHIVRNAIDHGIEAVEERRQLMKPETGEVTVEARQESGEVWIMISDDGRGLDRQKLLAKGIERGLVAGDGKDLTDQEVFRLIFEPGLSTAERVTEISGRGVGMDVVKRNIERLKGRVDVESLPGQGSMVTLHIPLTMAIIEGMLVRVGDSNYTIPIQAIRESLRPTPKSITRTPDRQELVKLRNELVPILRLHETYRRTPQHTTLSDGILVLVEDQDRRLALFADEIIGQQQTVIKALPQYLKSSQGISGCTILGDGSVSLILDIGRLVGTFGHTDVS